MNGVCVKCSFGSFFNSQRKCIKKPSDCFDFDIEENKCMQCYAGYSLDDDNNCVESEEDKTDPYCN